MITIITSCTANKDDSIPIRDNAKEVKPSDYVSGQELLRRLAETRRQIFQDPRAQLGQKETYAFDLYVNTGRAYKTLRQSFYRKTKNLLLADKIEWFFLSGGYGIIHALERARKYRATFSQNIAYRNKIPFTGKMWATSLPQICNQILSRDNPKMVFVFGSKDYTNFIKQTTRWTEMKNLRIFQSRGPSGPTWLSPKLAELLTALINDDIESFSNQYPNQVTPQTGTPRFTSSTI